MATVRPEIAVDPRGFGRKFPALPARVAPAPESSLGNDLRLFAATFAAGFLFVTIFIA